MNNKLFSLFIFLIFGITIAYTHGNISQRSSTSSNHNTGEIYDLEAMLGNPNYFHLNEADYPGCENPSITKATFRITEFEPDTLNLQATVGAPTMESSEILDKQYGILVNNSTITQTIPTQKFAFSNTNRAATTTTHGWKISGGINGYLEILGMQAEYNGSIANTIESTITKTYEAPSTPIMMAGETYTIYFASLKLLKVKGQYTFTQIMGGTMRPRYDRWCGNTIQPEGAKDRPKASINYFLCNNYDIRFFSGNLIPGPLGRIDNTFTLKGTGNYFISTGTSYVSDIFSQCSKDEYGPRCDPKCYTDPDNCPFINGSHNIRVYDRQKQLENKSTIGVPFGAHSLEKRPTRETPTLDTRYPF